MVNALERPRLWTKRRTDDLYFYLINRELLRVMPQDPDADLDERIATLYRVAAEDRIMGKVILLLNVLSILLSFYAITRGGR